MEICKKIKKIILNILESIPKSFIGVILSTIILISPLLNNKIAIGHDIGFHATNMMLTNNYIDIFKLDFLLPKIFGGTIANGFGYGTGIFYPPLSYHLTSYITYFLNLTNTNNLLSITCLEIIVVILSALIMYLFLKRVFKDDKVAGLGSISYISSTYFLCNIYTRCSLAEMLTFIFIPLIFWGLYELFYGNEKKFSILFVLGYVGMLNSHLVLSVYLTIIIIILFLCNLKQVLKKDKIKKLFISSIIVLLISSPYLLPLLEHKIFGNYVVFDSNSMYSDYWIKENTISLEELWTIGTKPNDIKIYINYIVLLTSILTIVFNKKIFSKENKSIYKITLLIIVITIVLSSSYFPWEKMPEFLKMIQFPWRLMGITSFGLAILSGNIVKIIKGDNKELIICILALGTILFGYNTIPQERVTDVIQIYEMSMGSQNEYLPSNTAENMNYFVNRNHDIIVKNGDVKINIIENNIPYLKSEITLNTSLSTIELPRLYYLGYTITLIDEKGNKEKIEYYENNYGFIELEVTKSGVLEISYEGTILNKISNYISVITSIICIILITKKQKKKSG